MQSMRAIQRTSQRAAAIWRQAPIRLNTNISGGSMGKAWADKEHAAENQYFNKKDAEMLATLASKLQAHTAPTEASIAVERQAVVAIFEKHGVSAPDALIEELVKYKFNHH